MYAYPGRALDDAAETESPACDVLVDLGREENPVCASSFGGDRTRGIPDPAVLCKRRRRRDYVDVEFPCASREPGLEHTRVEENDADDGWAIGGGNIECEATRRVLSGRRQLYPAGVRHVGVWAAAFRGGAQHEIKKVTVRILTCEEGDQAIAVDEEIAEAEDRKPCKKPSPCDSVFVASP